MAETTVNGENVIKDLTGTVINHDSTEDEEELDEAPTKSTSKMNPFNSPASCPYMSVDWDPIEPSTTCKSRIKKDIDLLFKDPPPGIFVIPKETDLTCVNAMIVGNFDTPYEGGFFHFYVRVPHNYPAAPPRVCSATSYRFGEKVRFNPNLYADGKVCLSILNTWEGPRWLPTFNLGYVLQSIQAAVFVEEALGNEPGYEKNKKRDSKMVELYDLYIRHETLRVAVIHILKNSKKCKVEESFVRHMEDLFKLYYDSYIESCNDFEKYDGVIKKPGIYNISFTPKFKELRLELIQIHDELEKSGNLNNLQLD